MTTIINESNLANELSPVLDSLIESIEAMRAILLQDKTLFTSQQLEALTNSFHQKEILQNDIEKLITKITNHPIFKGKHYQTLQEYLTHIETNYPKTKITNQCIKISDAIKICNQALATNQIIIDANLQYVQTIVDALSNQPNTKESAVYDAKGKIQK